MAAAAAPAIGNVAVRLCSRSILHPVSADTHKWCAEKRSKSNATGATTKCNIKRVTYITIHYPSTTTNGKSNAYANAMVPPNTRGSKAVLNHFSSSSTRQLTYKEAVCLPHIVHVLCC